MHIDEFTRLIGLLFILLVIGAGAWGVSQIAPQVQAVANLPAKIEAENTRLQSASELERAKAQEQIKTLPTLTALEIEKQRAQVRAIEQQAQAQVNAQLIEAQGKADGARAQGNALQMLAVAFGLAAVLVVGALLAREAMSARNFRTVIELCAREGGRLELPNGHAVTFTPASVRAQIGAPQQYPALGAGTQSDAANAPTGAPVATCATEQTKLQ